MYKKHFIFVIYFVDLCIIYSNPHFSNIVQAEKIPQVYSSLWCINLVVWLKVTRISL